MKVFNISDHPKFISVDVKYRGGTIKPGQSVEVTEMTPKAPCVVLTLPPWYVDWKTSLQAPQKVEPVLLPVEEKKVEEIKEEKKKKK
jgi:hypothetical protein